MEKKTKLTISGGIAKKSIRNIDKAKNLGKNSVIIEKQTGKFTSRGGSFKSNPSKIKNNFTSNKGTFGKPNYIPKSPPLTSDFERRKLAEQRATKRLKEEFGVVLLELGLKDPPLFGNFPVCFSMTTAFLL